LNGPVAAWEVIIAIADSILYDLEGGIDVQEGEDTCDWFHNDVDDIMLEICQVMHKSNPVWVQDRERHREIRRLQKKATGGAAYRYQRTLASIVDVETEPEKPKFSRRGRLPPPKLVLSDSEEDEDNGDDEDEDDH
jgi:hypothetical protein